MKKLLSVILTASIVSLMPLHALAEEMKPDAVVQATVQKPEAPLEFVDVTKKQIPLSSRLKKVYMGYNYTVTNRFSRPLEVMTGEISNGVNGQMGYLNVEKSSAGAIGAVLGGGLLLGLVTFGITFLAGLLVSPFIYAGNHVANTKARNEGLAFSSQVQTGLLNAGDTVSFSTLIPISQTPQIRLVIRDPQTKEIYSFNR